MRHAEAWARWARRQGTEVETLVDAQGENIVDSIVYLAKKEEIDLIAMEAHSGPIRTALVGSITRQVIRQSDCPVWVLRETAAGRAARGRKPPMARRAA